MSLLLPKFKRVLFFSCLVVKIAQGGEIVLPAPQHVISGSPLKIGTQFDVKGKAPGFEPVIAAFQADSDFLPPSAHQRVTALPDPSCPPEGYKIDFGRKIEIRASTTIGLAHGLSTLNQVRGQTVPYRSIMDSPTVGFRCVTLDVARRFHAISTLKTLVRWCAIGKIRYLQLHLTDDQNWMFPTKLFPGVDRGNQSGHPSYTVAELTSLQQFALARGVTIIPEVDMPGHSTLLEAADPGLFHIKGSASSNCVNFASPKARRQLKDLLREVMRTFPGSPYIHLGGDEAWYPDADSDPNFKAAEAKLGKEATPNDVFVDFLGEMTDTVISMGRTPLVWEGFSGSAFAKSRISRKTIVVAWDGSSYPAKQLTPDGFSVINAGWDPNYVVNHFPNDAYTLVPLETLYRSSYLDFNVVDPSPDLGATFQFQDRSKLKGAMLCWWEGWQANALRVLPSRILAFGARLWNPGGEVDFASLLDRESNCAKVIDLEAYPFSLSVTGGSRSNPSEFLTGMLVKVRARMPGLTFRWRTGGESLTAQDSKFGNETFFHAGSDVLIQAYLGQIPVGEPKFLRLTRVQPVPNLAEGCRVQTTAGYDPLFPPERVTSGVSGDLNSYWLAYPNPQDLTIDLGSVKPVSRIEVVTFWATSAPARYRLSVSADGGTFKEVADESKQILPSSKEGYIHPFPSTLARYVRIRTLGSDLYPASILRVNQIRVY